MRSYYLAPTDGRKSFYNKAVVLIADDGSDVLLSYNTPVMRRNPDGTLSRLWSDWSATTGRHIYAFCGIRKAEWDKMPVE